MERAARMPIQLSLFPATPDEQLTAFTKDWWRIHNYKPQVGGMTYLPIISKRLDTGKTLYTSGQQGYIHKIIDDKVIVFLAELWSGNWKVYENTWFVLEYKECNPVTRYGFDRTAFEKECPNVSTPEHILQMKNIIIKQWTHKQKN